ncbi:MAG: transposase [Lachnospiraceae bacterium]|nr:transposase [Lachnospiraceae bacterium]
MPADNTVTKTIWQYSEPLSEDTMQFLRGIAVDYCRVKNDVYRRYSSVKNLDRLTPVYSILNEMRYCGLREQLNLPSVYYELAIADAVTDIKASWGVVKNKLRELVTANENLSADDRQYLRTVLKINSVYAAVLKYEEYEMPKNAAKLNIDVNRLNNLLRRLTRKYLTRPKTDTTDSFRISPNGYSYKDGAMRIVCRIPRKRVSIPLKDDRTFDRQIQVQIKENYVALAVPVETKIKKHDDYTNTVYIYIGYQDMFTLSNGNIYGKALGELLSPETERLVRKNRERFRMYMLYEQHTESGNLRKADSIEMNNLGKSKYDRQKEKERQKAVTFINSEINRMLRLEKPGKIVITKPVIKNKTKQYSKLVNRKLSRSFRSYIRERLAYKCLINSIELIEINSNGTGSICSSCGAEGKRQGTVFTCENCGMQTTIPLNSARNIEIKCNNG